MCQCILVEPEADLRRIETPDQRSEIDFRMLSDPRDMVRLKEAFRIGLRAMTAAKQAGVVLDVFPSGYLPRIPNLRGRARAMRRSPQWPHR